MIDVNRLKTLMGSRTRGSGSDWDYIFYVSLNDMIRDLKTKTSLSLDYIDEDNPPDEIDLDEKYTAVMRDGIAYHMQKNATWARVSEEVSDVDYRKSMMEAVGESIEDELAAI